MKKLILSVLIGVSLVCVCSVTYTNATGNMLEYKKETIEDYINLDAIGGAVVSEEHTVFTLSSPSLGNAPKVNPEPVPVIDEKDITGGITEQDVVTINQAIGNLPSNTEINTEVVNATEDIKADIAKTEEIVNDYTVLENVKKEQEEQLKEQLRQERLAEFTWLSDLGVDISDLEDSRLNVLDEAHSYLGVWYKWGGTTPSGFDCSGYVQYVLRNAVNIELPRTTYSQVKSSHYEQIPIEDAKPGDIVFGHGLGHTGFFIKDNGDSILLLHAPETGKQVSITKYTRPVYAYRYI